MMTQISRFCLQGCKDKQKPFMALLWQGLQKSGFLALCVLKPRKSGYRFGCLACKAYSMIFSLDIKIDPLIFFIFAVLP